MDSVQFRASREKVVPPPLSAPLCCSPTQHAVGSGHRLHHGQTLYSRFPHRITGSPGVPPQQDRLPGEAPPGVQRQDSALQAEIITRDKIILDLKTKVNSLKQYNRKWCIRLNNMQLPHSDDTDTDIVMKTIYQKALLPILEGALLSKLLK